MLQVGQGSQLWGPIIIELEPEHAPRTVENFLRYVDKGFYDGTVFHRVLPEFLVQGGGYVAIGDRKRDGIDRPIPNEARNSPLKNVRGTIAAARTRSAHSATSEFFINLADNPKLDPPSFDGHGYAVFGRIVSGFDVLDRIAAVERRPDPRMPQELAQPVEPPVIRTARRLTTSAGDATERPTQVPPPAVRRPDPNTPGPRPGVRPGVPTPPVPEPEPELPPVEPWPEPIDDPGAEPYPDPIDEPLPEPVEPEPEPIEPDPAPEPEPTPAEPAPVW